MKHQVASTPPRAFQPSRLRLFAIVLAASLGITPGCGSDQQLSGAEFSDRLQKIYHEGSELWDRVAERAGDLEPAEPITGELEQSLHELVAFQRRAADELRELRAPATAEEEIEMLIEALQARTEAFEQALEARRFTGEQFDRITEAGGRIDLAFTQMRAEGILPTAEDNDPH